MPKKTLEIFRKILENKELSEELERVSPGIIAKMSGNIMSSWLPHGVRRKVAMLVITVSSLVGGMVYDLRWLYLLFLLPLFSPRIVGELTVFFGKLRK